MVRARAYEIDAGGGSGGSLGVGVGTAVIYAKDDTHYPIVGASIFIGNGSGGTLPVTGQTDGSGGLVFTNLDAGSYYATIVPPAGWLQPPDFFFNVVAGQTSAFEVTVQPDINAILLPPTSDLAQPVLGGGPVSVDCHSCWFSSVGRSVLSAGRAILGLDPILGAEAGVVGAVIGSVLPNGAVADTAGNVVGAVADAGGTVKDGAGNIIGAVSGSVAAVGGAIKDGAGNVIASIAPSIGGGGGGTASGSGTKGIPPPGNTGAGPKTDYTPFVVAGAAALAALAVFSSRKAD